MPAIPLFQGRLKDMTFTWRENDSSSSPPIDLTNATCTIYRHNLKAAPTITVLDPPAGHCQISFPVECTAGLNLKSGPYWVFIAMTYVSGAGFSPDPVRVEIDVGPPP